MKICVVGLGYIGLPSASMFASQGHDVVGVDISVSLIDALHRGEVPIREPGLNLLVQSASQSGHLRAQLTPEPADAFIIAVPTPLTDGYEQASGAPPKPDLSYVVSATRALIPHLRSGNLVILESTSPPGTTEHVVRPLLEESDLQAGKDFSLAYCAERVLPGRILLELVMNDRIIGGIDQPSAQRAAELYATFVEGEIFLTDATTAELVKLMENTYRDVNIALANEFSRVAEVLEVNVHAAINLANRHPRVDILRPGPGVGGHCIAVDPWFIVDAAPDVTEIIRTAREVNNGQPARVADRIAAAVSTVDNPIITLLGLAYKGDVDDFRESPALAVWNELRARGFAVRVHDPLIVAPVAGCNLEPELDSALCGVHLAVVLTDHSFYRTLEPRVFSVMARRFVLDTRGCLDSATFSAAGITLQLLGVSPAERAPAQDLNGPGTR